MSSDAIITTYRDAIDTDYVLTHMHDTVRISTHCLCSIKNATCVMLMHTGTARS